MVHFLLDAVLLWILNGELLVAVVELQDSLVANGLRSTQGSVDYFESLQCNSRLQLLYY
jgi:hypothetical protein